MTRWAAWVQLWPAFDAWQSGDLAAATRLIDQEVSGLARWSVEERDAMAFSAGQLLLNLGRVEAAMRVFESIQDPGLREVGLGFAAFATDDQAVARLHLARVPARPPDLWASLLAEVGLMLARAQDRAHAERLRLRIDEFSHPRAELTRAELMRAYGKRREAFGLFHTNLAYYRVGGRLPSILLASESLARLLESENDTRGAIQMLEEMAGPRTATYSAETLGSSGWAWLRCQRELVRLYRKAGNERRANEIQAEIRLLLSPADPAVKALNEARPQ